MQDLFNFNDNNQLLPASENAFLTFTLNFFQFKKTGVKTQTGKQSQIN